MSETIAVVGSCMIDCIWYSSRLPKLGETLIGNKYEQGFGGKGANQCVAAARLGASTIFIASLGADNLGHQYMEKLKKENIDISSLIIKKSSHTGMAQITVVESGENSIIVVPGANSLLSPTDIEDVKKRIQTASVLLCQFEIGLHTVIEALKLYKGHGISIVNAAPAVANMDMEILMLSDIFIVNEIEAEIITGFDNVTIENAQEVVDKFISLGCNTIIITFGAQGTVHASKTDKKIIHTPVAAVKAVDTTGAGDAFVGALAYYLANFKNFSLEECIKRSNQIATQSVLKKGTQSSYPFKKDLSTDLF